MQRPVFNVITLLAATTLSLTIPAILPDVSSLPEAVQRNAAGLRFGCVAAIAIGFLFGSLFLVLIGLLVYHSTAALSQHSDEDYEDPEVKSKAKKSKGGKRWSSGLTAGKVLGAIFGLIFLLWGVIFMYNMVAAIDILGNISKSVGEKEAHGRQ